MPSSLLLLWDLLTFPGLGSGQGNGRVITGLEKGSGDGHSDKSWGGCILNRPLKTTFDLTPPSILLKYSHCCRFVVEPSGSIFMCI